MLTKLTLSSILELTFSPVFVTLLGELLHMVVKGDLVVSVVEVEDVVEVGGGGGGNDGVVGQGQGVCLAECRSELYAGVRGVGREPYCCRGSLRLVETA
jgi:hypothetical protein